MSYAALSREELTLRPNASNINPENQIKGFLGHGLEPPVSSILRRRFIGIFGISWWSMVWFRSWFCFFLICECCLPLYDYLFSSCLYNIEMTIDASYVRYHMYVTRIYGYVYVHGQAIYAYITMHIKWNPTWVTLWGMSKAPRYACQQSTKDSFVHHN